MAKFAYAECFYPDSLNEIITIEAETLEEAKKKIIQKCKEFYEEGIVDPEDSILDTEDWSDFQGSMDEVFETIISEPVNIEYL